MKGKRKKEKRTKETDRQGRKGRGGGETAVTPGAGGMALCGSAERGGESAAPSPSRFPLFSAAFARPSRLRSRLSPSLAASHRYPAVPAVLSSICRLCRPAAAVARLFRRSPFSIRLLFPRRIFSRGSSSRVAETDARRARPSDRKTTCCGFSRRSLALS